MQIRTVLLPTDFSSCAEGAHEHAAFFAKAANAKVICLHVVEPVVPAVSYTGLAEPLPVADLADEMQDSAESELPKTANCPELAGLEVEEVITHGDPASEIVRLAAERAVDLIVIATHGRTGIQRMLFGSTAEAVVRQSPCPVLVVKSHVKRNSDG